MKKVYATWVTEYEFGQRDAGVNFSEDIEALGKEIKRIHSIGDRDGYFRCSEPIEVHVDPKVWRKYGRKKDVKVFYEHALPEGFYRSLAEKKP